MDNNDNVPAETFIEKHILHCYVKSFTVKAGDWETHTAVATAAAPTSLTFLKLKKQRDINEAGQSRKR